MFDLFCVIACSCVRNQAQPQHAHPHVTGHHHFRRCRHANCIGPNRTQKPEFSARLKARAAHHSIHPLVQCDLRPCTGNPVCQRTQLRVISPGQWREARAPPPILRPPPAIPPPPPPPVAMIAHHHQAAPPRTPAPPPPPPLT